MAITIDEAIERTQRMKDTLRGDYAQADRDALGLGIEALKRVKTARAPSGRPFAPLPGEKLGEKLED